MSAFPMGDNGSAQLFTFAPWWDDEDTIPSGWVLADGRDTTPDLRDFQGIERWVMCTNGWTHSALWGIK